MKNNRSSCVYKTINVLNKCFFSFFFCFWRDLPGIHWEKWTVWFFNFFFKPGGLETFFNIININTSEVFPRRQTKKIALFSTSMHSYKLSFMITLITTVKLSSRKKTKAEQAQASVPFSALITVDARWHTGRLRDADTWNLKWCQTVTFRDRSPQAEFSPIFYSLCQWRTFLIHITAPELHRGRDFQPMPIQ